MRLPAQVLHAALQDWELAELHKGQKTTGQPLYCQGVFDAITMGEVFFMAMVTGAASETKTKCCRETLENLA